MASSSHDTGRASSDAPECIEEIFTMEHHYYKRLRPKSLILKDVSTLKCYSEQLSRSNDPEEQLLQKIRDGASEEVLESYLSMTFQNISDGGDVEINEELASASPDEQRNEREKKRALARARVYDKALGEAKDGTAIEEFLVKKLLTDECLQRGGHWAMVDCSAVRWNMVNIVLAWIRWRGAAEDGTFLEKERLLAVAVEYGHVELVQHLTNKSLEQLIQGIRDGASEEVLESYLNMTFQNISDGGDVEINEELASASPDEQRNERDKKRALARARVYDKALGEAKDGTAIEEFLVKKLLTDECLQRGGHWAMVDCSPVRLNMVNIVLALIRWRRAAEDGTFLEKEGLLAVAVEYGHVELVQHLTNKSLEQLIQGIRDGASEEVLESYLNTTFQNISDGGDVEVNEELASASLDEQRNEGDKKRALARARARVYDKALGEAKDGTPIEQFLVKKLLIDECLQSGGDCAMVDCSAARWNMVNIVLALIRWRGAAEDGRLLENRELLTTAVQSGHVELVKQLTKMQDVDINIGSPFQIVGMKGGIIKPNNIRFMYHQHDKFDRSGKSRKYYFGRLNPIDYAAGMGNVKMVMALLACDRIDVNEGSPLHWAVAMGHLHVVKELLDSKKPVDVNALKWIPLGDKHEAYSTLVFSPLHLASLFGHASVVKFLCEDTEGRLRANTESKEGITPLQIATEMKHDEIVKTLVERPEVAKQVKDLYRDRQVHVDAANAILVGAALIASVTFAGWLTPPLGYSAFFGSASIDVGAPSPSGIYPSFVSVAGHPIMQIFWFFNSMSFFFAIATLMVGATAARPLQRGIFIGEVVKSLRDSLSLAYVLLTISVVFVMGAFASAGFLVLPPIPKYEVNMRVTVGIGVTVVFLALSKALI